MRFHMQSFLQIGIGFFKFWYLEAPIGLIKYFTSLNYALLKKLSLPLLLLTFFKPWKNEYRQGLVGFSIIMGVIIKSLLISFDLSIFLMLLIAEVLFLFIFVIWPIGTVFLLFIPNL